MARMYFTITGLDHRYGQAFLKPGMKVTLEKEPDNKTDSEAILVKMEGLGPIGYVANSVYTRVRDSYSAGRLYDKIEDGCAGTILYILESGALAFIEKEGE